MPFYCLRWQTSEYSLVGPFFTDTPAYHWGESHANPDEPYCGWDVIELNEPHLPPKIIDPERPLPRPKQPFHLTLHPTLEAFATGAEMAGRVFIGHTACGTPVNVYVAAVCPRELLSDEEPTGPYAGLEAVRRELDAIPGPPISSSEPVPSRVLTEEV